MFNDPPLHTRVRRLILGALSQRHIAGNGTRAGRAGRRAARRDGRASGRVDLIEDFAAAIPIEIIGNLLGVPRAERGPLRGLVAGDPGRAGAGADARARRRRQRRRARNARLSREVVDERRRRPGDPDTDVLTRLIQGESRRRAAHRERTAAPVHLPAQCRPRDDDQPDRQRAACAGAMAGGSERLVANLDDPSSSSRRSRNSFASKARTSSATGSRRRRPSVGGVTLPADSRITLCIGAANRDPAQFPDPDRLDLAREPNKHLAFAHGIHTCAGMNLARLEARVALSRFLARFPDYALDGEPTARRARALSRASCTCPAVSKGDRAARSSSSGAAPASSIFPSHLPCTCRRRARSMSRNFQYGLKIGRTEAQTHGCT